MQWSWKEASYFKLHFFYSASALGIDKCRKKTQFDQSDTDCYVLLHLSKLDHLHVKWSLLIEHHDSHYPLCTFLLDIDCWFSHLCARRLTAFYFLLFPKHFRDMSGNGLAANPAVQSSCSSLTGFNLRETQCPGAGSPTCRSHDSAPLPCYPGCVVSEVFPSQYLNEIPSRGVNLTLGVMSTLLRSSLQMYSLHYWTPATKLAFLWINEATNRPIFFQ